jgi:uncharacterized protein (DUF1501 family)
MTRRTLLQLAAIYPASTSSRVDTCCILLRGGNDGHNTSIRLADYETYRRARGELALPKDALVPMGEYGLHPALAPLREFSIRIVEDVRSKSLIHADAIRACPAPDIILDGFDTHGNQLELHHRALERFASVAYDQVSRGAVVYTASEFGRSLRPNTSGGTDHDYLSRQLIIWKSDLKMLL